MHLNGMAFIGYNIVNHISVPYFEGFPRSRSTRIPLFADAFWRLCSLFLIIYVLLLSFHQLRMGVA